MNYTTASGASTYWYPSFPDLSVRQAALEKAIECRRDIEESASDTVARAKEFEAYLRGDVAKLEG